MSINNSPEREKLVASILPKKPITETILLPALKNQLIGPLLRTLKEEIKVYRKFPKVNGTYKPDIFDPRNPQTCFMGHGFYANSKGYEGWYDAELVKYRNAVGTLPHTRWGDTTVLEIWAADHFEKYPEMVKAVYDYGFDKIKRMPKIKFHIMPFMITSETGTPRDNGERKQAEETQDALIDMLANARAEKLFKQWKAKSRNRSYDEEDEEDDD